MNLDRDEIIKRVAAVLLEFGRSKYHSSLYHETTRVKVAKAVADALMKETDND